MRRTLSEVSSSISHRNASAQKDARRSGSFASKHNATRRDVVTSCAIQRAHLARSPVAERAPIGSYGADAASVVRRVARSTERHAAAGHAVRAVEAELVDGARD